MILSHRRLAASVVLLLWLTSSASAQTPNSDPPFDVAASYTKREVMIPVRDGVRLFTAIYSPKDAAPDKTYPVMLTRTPYSVAPYGATSYRESLGPSAAFAREGYIFVYQDVRGRFMSEGEFVHVRPRRGAGGGTEIDESTDTYDTVEWLLKNVTGHNGRVGMWGISYPGFYTSTGVIDAHPAIKAASPQAPVADWFIGDDWHHNGTLFLAHAFTWLYNNDRPRPAPTTEPPPRLQYPTPDAYRFFLDAKAIAEINEKYFKGERPFWNEILRHPNYDEFWQARNILPRLVQIRPAVMTVGGWFDSENLYGALKTYEAIEQQNRNVTNILVMGPWEHGHWAGTDGDWLGDLRFGAKTAQFYRASIELPFFNHHLKDKKAAPPAEAHLFDTGTNEWRAYDSFPPRGSVRQSLYFHHDGQLSFDAPAGNERNLFDEYVSDPHRPVPHLPGVFPGMKRGYMAEDQRFASRRPDVLVYQTEPLAEEMTVCGPVTPSLYVSTTGTDADYVVKLIDVFPDDAPDPAPNPSGVRMGGFQMLVRGEPFRARFRNGFARPEAMRPGAVTRVGFEMPGVCHTFRRGHRVMAHIQSTWFPLVDRNPQQFVPNINTATEKDFRTATQRLHRARRHASHLTLVVAPRPKKP